MRKKINIEKQDYIFLLYTFFLSSFTNFTYQEYFINSKKSCKMFFRGFKFTQGNNKT